MKNHASQKIFLFPNLARFSLLLTMWAPSPEKTPAINLPAAQETSPNLNLTEIKAARPWRIALIPKFKFLGETSSLSPHRQPAWEGAQQAGRDFGVQVDWVIAPLDAKHLAQVAENASVAGIPFIILPRMPLVAAENVAEYLSQWNLN